MSYVEMASHLTSLPVTGGEQPPGDPAQQKKELRKNISVEKTNDNLGFLHAALVEINGKSILLAGPSGIGKTCYISHIGESHKIRKLASDWTAVEMDNGQFWGSDLNYPDKLQSTGRKNIDAVMFLTFNPGLERDAYSPNRTEFIEILRETFDTASPSQSDRLISFWLKNYDRLPSISVMPARRASEMFITETIGYVLNRIEKHSSGLNIGIIGTGSVGSTLANDMGHLTGVRDINLYDHDPNKPLGLCLDLSHSYAGSGINFYPRSEPQQIFANSDVVFLAFRDNETINLQGVPERWGKIGRHLGIMGSYSRIANETGFKGTIFVITNPVDILTYAAYRSDTEAHRQLRTFQVYGIGLELDAMRAIYYGRQYKPDLRPEDLLLFGNHSDTFYVDAPLPDQQLSELRNNVAKASPQVRQYIPRTIYGPVGSAIKTLKSFLNNGEVHTTVIQENAFMGRKIKFQNGLPLLTEIPDIHEYQQIFEENKKSAELINALMNGFK